MGEAFLVGVFPGKEIRARRGIRAGAASLLKGAWGAFIMGVWYISSDGLARSEWQGVGPSRQSDVDTGGG